jgi:ribosomal protein S27AE
MFAIENSKKYMKIPVKCSKCGAEMEAGFMLEHRKALRWVAGTPQTSLLGDVKTGSEQHHSESYRCVGCGYLQSYARIKIH